MTTPEQSESFKTNQFGDKYLYSINQEDFNLLGSKSLYEQRLKEGLFKEHHLYFVVGSDSALLPEYLVGKGVPIGSRYIFIEPAHLIKRLGPRIVGLHERVFISTPENALSSIEEQSELGAAYYIYRDNVEIIQSIGCRHDYQNLYFQIPIRLSEELDSYRYTVHGSINIHNHYINQITNVVDEPNPSLFLTKILSGKTAAVLAGGPSLDQGLNWVKRHRKDLLVIAVSRICRQLIQADITPDIVVTSDPTIMSFEISRELLELEGCLFAHQSGASHLLIGQWGGMQAYFGSRLPWPTTVNNFNLTLGGGNTIANLAVDLAAATGATQIILFGVNLCYATDGNTHAHGSNESKIPPPLQLNILEVETNDGRKTDTTPDLYQSAQSLNKYAKSLISAGAKLINPAPDAIRLEHVAYIPIEQLRPDPMERPAIETIRAAYPDTQVTEYLEQLSEALNSSKSQLKTLEESANRGLKVVKHILNGRQSSKNPYSLLEKIRQRINDNQMSIATRQFAWEVFAKISLTLEGEKNDTERPVKAAKEYFEACIAGCDRMETHLDDALQRLKCRQEELKENPDFDLMFDQWQKDKQFGRATLWKQRHPDNFETLNCDIKSQFEQLENDFRFQLTRDDTNHVERLRKKSDINLALQRTTNLYLQHNSAGLERLCSMLKHYPEHEAEPFIQFAQGMLAELKGDSKAALIHYEQILHSGCEALFEHTLKRITSLCIESGDYENAIFALEGLTHISTQYLRDYAEILSAVGLNEESYQAYLQYLESHPNDNAALMKFGILCTQLNQLETVQKTEQQLKKCGEDSVEYQKLSEVIQQYINQQQDTPPD